VSTVPHRDPHRDRALCRRSCPRWGSPLAFSLSLSLAAAWPAERAFAQPAAPQPAAAPSANSAPPAAAPNTPAPGTAAPSTPAAPVAPLAESLHGSAQADYAGARILYEDGDYAGAYTKLESAYLASKDPRLLWNMAACEKAQRHYANVMNLLERYLTEGGALIGTDERQATHELVETVREFVNELRLDVQPAGVEVYVDGVKAATTPLAGPLRVDMGKRKLSFQKAGFVAHETEMDLAGGKSVDLKVQLQTEVHEGTLRIMSDPSAVISVDGHVVGTGQWVGTLASGTHSVYVSAEGKQPYKTEVVVKDRDTASLHVNLQGEQGPPGLKADSSSGALWWIVGGVALAGAGVGGYFLLKPGDGSAPTPEGTLGGFEL
jgi:PEGA domain-containing protein